MPIEVRSFCPSDSEKAAEIWNRVVEDGVAFPQEETLSAPGAEEFFMSQTYTGIAYDTGTDEILGLYILHPNNIGRCGHIANCSYAVRYDVRGRHVGEHLVSDSKIKAKEKGFRIIQFNAVVATNAPALKLYKKMGFSRTGTIPGGFRMKDGHYEDIVVHHINL